MKLLIAKKDFVTFLIIAIVCSTWFVVVIEVTPKMYNSVIAVLFMSSFLFGATFSEFQYKVREKKQIAKT